ncbi:MAG: enoyl-CoA hydratase/isomerase family protein [Candidatus Heimdallarchaeota archaeon]|nr:MAG: enoyl-CoA hydratase/isomerase family protein [Candidatus Heimdallarchaeota archaeon]
MISIEVSETVGILKLNRGITNAINLELVNELTINLQKMRQDSDIRSIVLTSSNEKFFAIGFDIPELIKLSLEDFKVFYRSYNRLCLDLYSFPKPTIVAITGHAIAGGCILALCCDYRIIGEGRKLMGLNEIKLGVPVPYPGDCILRQIVGPRNAQEITYTGDFYPSEKLLQMGMVDKVVPLKQVRNEAIDKAKLLGSSSQGAFAMIKHNRIEIVEAQILKRLTEKEQSFLKHWFSAEARNQLEEAIKKF